MPFYLVATIALTVFGIGAVAGHAIGYGRGLHDGYAKGHTAGRITGLRYAANAMSAMSAVRAKAAIRHEEVRVRGDD